MIEVTAPAAQFFDLNGDPLDMGRIYIGVSGQNPETNPQAVFWDSAGTIPAAQPIETRDGYPYRDGAAAKFYTNAANYSITVRNKRGELVVSSLDTNSGVFDELQASTGAANVGYNNAVSGLAATDVQAALDKLKSDADSLETTVNGIASGAPLAVNLFANSAFLINQRAYASGTATTGANQYTIDRIRVVVSGQALTWVAGTTYGNRITAPAGGAEQVIEGSRIVGGDYACTWDGAGTIEVNGAPQIKGAKFSLPANTNATVRMFGEFERFMFTRPNMLGNYEYDLPRDLQLCQRYYWRGLPTTKLNTQAYAAEAVIVWPVPFPVTMRSVPTVGISFGGATFTGLGSPSFDSATKDGARFLVKASAASVNATIDWVPGTNYFEATAEL